MDKLLIVCGPTATGKTGLAIHLAKHFNGELINADSRQVYHGMDIVTGKDIPVNSELRTKDLKLKGINKNFTLGYRKKDSIPIWLVDIVDPYYRFNVGEYQRLTLSVIKDIHKRGKLPIVVGGTGLYIRAITQFPPLMQIPTNAKLRKQLGSYTLGKLQKKLQEVDVGRWNNMNRSDRSNHRRLVRAIEISEHQQSKDFNTVKYLGKNELPSSSDLLMIGLAAPKTMLKKRIDQRVEKRVKEGALEEVKKLLQAGFNKNLASFTACGYQELIEYIEHKLTLEKAQEKWRRAEYAYARRQMTWFKKDKKIQWFSITSKDYRDEIVQKVEKWYTL